MTTPQQYSDDRDFVVHTTAHVFRLFGTLVRLWFVLAGVIFLGCVLFVIGEAIVLNPVPGVSIIAGLITLAWWRIRVTERQNRERRERQAARKAELYRQNEIQRAKNFPEIVFEENQRAWEKELAV
jgi:uncharacterized membrane protein